MPAPYLKRAPNGVYNIHETDASGRNKRRSTGTRDLAEAKAVFGEWLLIQNGPEAVRDATVAELWASYEKRHARKLASSPTVDYSWKNLKPHFGELTARTITQVAVESYVELRASGKIGHPSGPSTCRRELAQLVACANFNKVAINIDLPPAGAPRDRWLRTEEIRRLMAAARAMRPDTAPGQLCRAERFLWLALETAGRRSALIELTWDRVDFETNVVHLNVPGRTITKKRRADVPMSKTLRAVLEQAYRERDDEFVVGGVNVRRVLHQTAALAKIAGLTPNVLRHTAATHMARRGVPLWIIAKVLGNTVQMVERVYAKHSPDDLRAAVNLISAGVEWGVGGENSPIGERKAA